VTKREIHHRMVTRDNLDAVSVILHGNTDRMYIVNAVRHVECDFVRLLGHKV
jgi:hypothetical protein